MKVGPSPQALPHEINELLECLLFAGAIGGATCVERRLLRLDGHRAEEILQATRWVEERETFHVEEDITRRRRRHQAEAVFGSWRKQVVSMHAGRPEMRLQRGLMAQA